MLPSNSQGVVGTHKDAPVLKGGSLGENGSMRDGPTSKSELVMVPAGFELDMNLSWLCTIRKGQHQASGPVEGVGSLGPLKHVGNQMPPMLALEA